jgi:hypothetical protein
MRLSIKLVGALVIVVGAACGPMEAEEAAELSSGTQAALEEKLLSDEELRAMVEEAEKNPPMFKALACPATNACDPSYAACTSWAEVANCGNVYQVCFNPYGAQCINIGW